MAFRMFGRPEPVVREIEPGSATSHARPARRAEDLLAPAGEGWGAQAWGYEPGYGAAHPTEAGSAPHAVTPPPQVDGRAGPGSGWPGVGAQAWPEHAGSLPAHPSWPHPGAGAPAWPEQVPQAPDPAAWAATQQPHASYDAVPHPTAQYPPPHPSSPYSTGQYPPGQLPAAQYPPAQVHSTQYPAAQVHSTQYPSAQCPPEPYGVAPNQAPPYAAAPAQVLRYEAAAQVDVAPHQAPYAAVPLHEPASPSAPQQPAHHQIAPYEGEAHENGGYGNAGSSGATYDSAGYASAGYDMGHDAGYDGAGRGNASYDSPAYDSAPYDDAAHDSGPREAPLAAAAPADHARGPWDHVPADLVPHPAEASALAAAFAADYLSWDEDDPQLRARVLGDYLATRRPVLLGWSGQGRQRADFALPGLVRPDGDGRVLVDVRVRVTPYCRVPGGRPLPPDEPDDGPTTLSAAPAPAARGWRGLPGRWVRLSVAVAALGDRLVVDAEDEAEEPWPTDAEIADDLPEEPR